MSADNDQERELVVNFVLGVAVGGVFMLGLVAIIVFIHRVAFP